MVLSPQYNVGVFTGPDIQHMFSLDIGDPHTPHPSSSSSHRDTPENTELEEIYDKTLLSSSLLLPPPPPAGLIPRAIIASNTNTDWPSFDRMPLMRDKL